MPPKVSPEAHRSVLQDTIFLLERPFNELILTLERIRDGAPDRGLEGRPDYSQLLARCLLHAGQHRFSDLHKEILQDFLK